MVSPTERGDGIEYGPEQKLLSVLKFKAINDCHPIHCDTFQAKLCVDTSFPAMENLVGDIPDGTGKSLTFFYSVQLVFNIVMCAPTAACFSLHFKSLSGSIV